MYPIDEESKKCGSLFPAADKCYGQGRCAANLIADCCKCNLGFNVDERIPPSISAVEPMCKALINLLECTCVGSTGQGWGENEKVITRHFYNGIDTDVVVLP